MKFRLAIILFATLIAGSACNKKDETTDPQPTAGRISGSVNLYDEATAPLDNSGMTVTVEGSNPLITTTTNAAGRFTLEDVPFGVKTLLYEKEGYGTFRKPTINHTYNNGLGTSLDTTSSLGKKSGTAVVSTACFPDGKDLLAEVSTSPAANSSNYKYIRLFMDTKSGVSSTSYAACTENYTIGINPAEIRISAAALSKMGFHSGETIYIRGYGDSFWSNDYTETVSGKRVFPNLNPLTANEAQVIVP
jgi:hypothetical protein